MCDNTPPTYSRGSYPITANDANSITLRGYFPFSMSNSVYQCRDKPAAWFLGQRNPICGMNQVDNLANSKQNTCPSFYYDFSK